MRRCALFLCTILFTWTAHATTVDTLSVEEAQLRYNQLLECELTIEFRTGSPYLGNILQENAIENCDAVVNDGHLHLARGYTNHEEWNAAGGDNWANDNDPDKSAFWINEEFENPLGNQRAYNFYSLMINDEDVTMVPESMYFMSTPGEHKKTVKVFRVPEGMAPEDVARIVGMLEEILGILEDVEADVSYIRDNSDETLEMLGIIMDLMEQMDRRLTGIESDVEELQNSISFWKRIYFAPGYQGSSFLKDGYALRAGLESRWGSFFLNGSLTRKNHEREVLERGAPGTPLWGQFFTVGAGAEVRLLSTDFLSLLFGMSGGYFSRDLNNPTLPEGHFERGYILTPVEVAIQAHIFRDDFATFELRGYLDRFDHDEDHLLEDVDGPFWEPRVRASIRIGGILRVLNRE